MQSDFFQQTSKVLTVAELTRAIRGTLETKFGAVWVQGEISNYKLHPSGHQYFTLKDQRAQIACVIFRNTLPPFPRPLADGAQVQIYGQISVFEARGQYQLSVQILQTRGLGLLQAKFEALKRKLEAEGLFDPARKRPLPRHPRRIGIVTSSSGAAIRDILHVLQRRAPALQILIHPVRVQGTGAAAEIAVALRELTQPNELWEPLDLVVVTRGGGSIEDLWEFNEEIVSRAIFDSPLPIVSAIGHEIDFTIADFVADLRAPTPSAAAELIVPDRIDLLRRLDELSAGLQRNLRNFLSQSQTRLRFLSEKTLARELTKRLQEAQQKIDWARESLGQLIGRAVLQAGRALASRAQTLQAHTPVRELATRAERMKALQRRIDALPPGVLHNARQRFLRTEAMLRVLGPDATLRRGYSITSGGKGQIIASVRQVTAGMPLRTRVADGTFESAATDEINSSGS
ncbi:MAG TPA: exodeoxyribonuclease VII large subunit [Chthoniobacterales bacterium]|nr:exodeoxyribonuclease VII large subunit [Chthoniobacterales bacterium]